MQSALQSRRHAFDLIVGYVVEERQRQGARCDRFRHGQMCGTAPGRISMLKMNRREVTPNCDSLLSEFTHDAIAVSP
jgi:hypothetical protein